MRHFNGYFEAPFIILEDYLTKFPGTVCVNYPSTRKSTPLPFKGSSSVSFFKFNFDKTFENLSWKFTRPPQKFSFDNFVRFAPDAY